MKFVEIKTENSLGGRLSKDGTKVIVAIREGGNTIIEILDATEDIIGKIVEKAVPLYYALKSFFDDIFNNLPTFIISNERKYRLALFPAGGREEDFVHYLFEDDMNISLYTTSAHNLAMAKNEMHSLLQLEDIII